MQKNPNTGCYYKNLADMMTTKMEMLADEVGLLKDFLFVLEVVS